MKKLPMFLLMFSMILVGAALINNSRQEISATTVSDTASGIAITNCEELQAMRDNLAGNYYLANDIDASDTVNWNGGLGFNPIGTFTGIFDGNGYTITGLYINRPSSNEVGLFSDTNGTEIKNVGLINVDISSNGSFNAGGLIGVCKSSVTNCYVTGSVNGSSGNAGGLIGYNEATITNCYSAAAVSGAIPGGLVSVNSGGIYNDCFWDTETSGQATSAGGTGKTTAEMKQQATFTNWDFTDIWEITKGITYPFLR